MNGKEQHIQIAKISESGLQSSRFQFAKEELPGIILIRILKSQLDSVTEYSESPVHCYGWGEWQHSYHVICHPNLLILLI